MSIEHALIIKHVEAFCKAFNVYAPIDCVRAIGTIPSLKLLTSTVLPDKVDAMTLPYMKGYLIVLNFNRVHYPYQTSKDRRLNFTLAHELGHIFLGHLEPLTGKKSDDMLNKEEQEANAFASELLMPKPLLLSLNYKNFEKVARYLHISQSALEARLSSIQHMPTKERVYINCQGTPHTIHARYCIYCGELLCQKDDGVRKKHKEALPREPHQCFLCHHSTQTHHICPVCHTPLHNQCPQCGQQLLDCAYYCELCGVSSLYHEKNLLWLFD